MDIQFIRSNRRTMAIEITGDLRVLVRLPLRCSDAEAAAFVEKHKNWIAVHYQRQQERLRRQPTPEQMELLRKKAKTVLPGRVEYFARLTGLHPTGVRITSARTRFGSCSGKNSLNFSLYLMQYSPGAVDYVVLHEVAHIKYKNHSRDFYRFIEQYMPDYKQYIKELKA